MFLGDMDHRLLWCCCGLLCNLSCLATTWQTLRGSIHQRGLVRRSESCDRGGGEASISYREYQRRESPMTAVLTAWRISKMPAHTGIRPAERVGGKPGAQSIGVPHITSSHAYSSELVACSSQFRKSFRRPRFQALYIARQSFETDDLTSHDSNFPCFFG